MEFKGDICKKITPCLWFDNQAEEAANFYTSIFKNSNIGNISRYGKEGYEIPDKAMESSCLNTDPPESS